MNLNQPIVVTPDPIRKRNGSLKNLPSISLNSLDFVILDDVKNKTCSVRIKPFPTPLVLWSGQSYDEAGDYTQAALEVRLLEVLGDNPADVLKGLVPNNEIIVKSLT